jgi:hypothetical protein
MTSARSTEDRWRRRLERERSARRQAERLAERGMRELWQANQDLHQRVSERTSAIDRQLAVAAHLTRARLAVLAGLVSRAVSTPGDAGQLDAAQFRAWADQLSVGVYGSAEPDGGGTETEVRSPHDALDDLVDRWQRPAARRALLLAPTASGTHEVIAPWSRLIAAAHAVLGCIVSAGEPGPLHLEIADTSDGVVATIDDAGPPLPADAALPDVALPGVAWPGAGGGAVGPEAWLSCTAVGGRGVGLAIAQHVALAGGLSMSVTQGPLGGARVVVAYRRR